MTFLRIWRATWACEPTVAAGNVTEAAWTGSPRLLTKPEDHDDPLRKVVLLFTARQLIARVVCSLSTGQRRTCVELLVPERASRERAEVVRKLIGRMEQRATEQRLVPNPIGFRPNGGDK